MITIRNSWVLALVLLVAACTTAYQGAVVTATNLDNQFVTTGKAMDNLVRTGKITWDQYKPWSDFSGKYKILSGSAYTALKAGKDAKSVQDATAIINQLESELAMYLIYTQGK
jgi:hypothetical protein